MAETARQRLTLRLAALAGGSWEASCADHAWGVRPAWPADHETAQLDWLVEEGASAGPLQTYVAETVSLAQAVGEKLWDSLVEGAPQAVRAQLDQCAPNVELNVPDPHRLWALSLLHTPTEGWVCLAGGRVTMRAGPLLPERKRTLRILLAIARPDGDDDAPYLNVAYPLSLDLAPDGVAIDRVFPARRRDIAARLSAAREKGDPYTALIFDGHGVASPGQTPSIALEGPGMPAWLAADEFAELLGEDPPSLIVLAACRSGRMAHREDGAASFATALAQATGSDVIAMSHSVAPDLTSAFTAALFGALVAGAEVETAVGIARRSLHSAQPAGLGWSAPLHIGSATLKFTVEPGAVAPPPAGVVRDHACLAADRRLERDGLIVCWGLPLVGKTTFSDFYAWWRSSRSADQAPPLFLDARPFANPYELLNQHIDDYTVDGRLVVIDNAEHWANVGEAELDLLRQVAVKLQSRGVRWMVNSRRPLTISGEGVAEPILLVGLGRQGLFGETEFGAVAASYLDPNWRGDPWLRLLMLAVAGEPKMLAWAADAYARGETGKSLLWRFVFPSVALLSEIDDRDAGLVDLDPMQGWMFGSDRRRLLAILETPEADWEVADLDRLSERHAIAIAPHIRAGTALPGPGGGWQISALQAAILRSKRPKETWTAETRARFASYLASIRMTYFIDEEAPPAAIVAALSSVPATVSAPTVSARWLTWIAFLECLPMALAAAEIAAEDGRAKDVADIASGMARALMEFSLMESCHAWLEHWRQIVAALAAAGAEHGEAALASLDDDLARFKIHAGDESLEDAGRVRLARLAQAVGIVVDDPHDVRAVLNHVISGLRTGLNGARARFGDLLNTLSMMAMNVGADALEPDQLNDLLAAAGPDINLADRVRVLGIRAAALVARNQLAEAEAVVRGAVALSQPLPSLARFQIALTLTEILSITSAPDALEQAYRVVDIARGLGDPLALGQAIFQLATTYGGCGAFDRARELGLRSLPRLAGQPVSQVQAYLWLAKIASAQNDLAVAEAYRAQGEKLAARAGSTVLQMEAISLAGILALQADDIEPLEAASGRLLDTALAHGHAHGEGLGRWLRGEARFLRGDSAGAIEDAQMATRLLRPSPGDGYCGYAWKLLGKALDAQGDADGACEAQHKAAEQFDEHFVDPRERASEWARLELLAICASRRDLADVAYDRLTTLAPGLPIFGSDQLLFTARAWEVVEEHQRARARAEEALARFDSFGPEDHADLQRIARMA